MAAASLGLVMTPSAAAAQARGTWAPEHPATRPSPPPGLEHIQDTDSVHPPGLHSRKGASEAELWSSSTNSGSPKCVDDIEVLSSSEESSSSCVEAALTAFTTDEAFKLDRYFASLPGRESGAVDTLYSTSTDEYPPILGTASPLLGTASPWESSIMMARDSYEVGLSSWEYHQWYASLRQAPVPRFCTQCGGERSPEYTFCPHCGVRLE
eukprot:TRINITY_DN15557_c0_g1_i1.p1 TRINITY_DN15557_c0_g1~~TRINITY_DN15557_c0_g1_i1.p1  ORF type:complete len:210 (+),score=24.38 TRINITY_DN15557_c0_g1_i1:61-690(+)